VGPGITILSILGFDAKGEQEALLMKPFALTHSLDNLLRLLQTRLFRMPQASRMRCSLPDLLIEITSLVFSRIKRPIIPQI
jgi:hypothetical protein